MEFEIVSHACVSVRAASVRLVIDPWLIGPVYWGAWWHCPEPVYDEGIFRPDYIYFTHWHFDHLNEESLKHVDKNTHLMVPKFPVSMMAQTLRDLGFKAITELDHGRPFELAKGFRISSYQVSYQDDSVCLLEADGVVIANLNDAKPLPRTWRRLRNTYPKVDFMLRSHSPAWSYPSRFTFGNPDDGIPVTRESYMEAWRNAASILKPTYGIPFASSVCHPHPEVLAENDEMITAYELADYIACHPIEDTELVMMPPGSRWSSENGFDCKLENAVRSPRAYVEQRSDRDREWLVPLNSMEKERTISFETFEGFFGNFFACPIMIPVRPFLKIKLVFVVEEEDGSPYWSADFRSGKIERLNEEPRDCTSVIRVHPAVLDDALRSHTFTNIDTSKRWRVHVNRGGVANHLIGWVLISLYEAGYLQLRNLLSRRFVSGVFARRSEVLDYLGLCFKMWRKGTRDAAKSLTDSI